MNNPVAKSLIVIGLLLVLAGIALLIFQRFPFIGHLPGDIKIVRKNFVFYFPITSMIIISIVVSLLLFLLRKFF